MSTALTPELYELAFSYRDYEAEVDFIELCWQRHASTDNTCVLDIACGIGEHLHQLCLRGYDCCGFDIDERMVEFATAKFAAEELPIEVWTADMRDFEVERPFGLATNMLTSANLLLTNEALENHLRLVARALEPGGIYLLEMFHPRAYGFGPDILAYAWEVQRDDVHLECDLHHQRKPLDPIRQCQETTMHIAVTKGGKTEVIEHRRRQRVYLYHEFRAIVGCTRNFEILDCFGAFNAGRKLDNSQRSWRMIPVLRRTEEDVK